MGRWGSAERGDNGYDNNFHANEHHKHNRLIDVHCTLSEPHLDGSGVYDSLCVT